MLQHLGFGRLFIEWVCIILSTASSKFVLNGFPRRAILHHCGLRQADPLFPVLFLFFMEILNAALRRVEDLGVLSPLTCRGICFSTSVYTDDIVIFVHPTARDLGVVRMILQCFGDATNLRTNFDKCSFSPIRCTDEHLAIAA